MDGGKMYNFGDTFDNKLVCSILADDAVSMGEECSH